MTRPDPLPVPPSEEQEREVIDFLRAQPDFFLRHGELLAELPLRHAAGGAASLIERQVQVLRQTNQRLSQRLSQLMDTARANEQRVVGMNHLARKLIEAEDLASAVGDLADVLHDQFGVSAICIGLFQPVEQADALPQPPCLLLDRPALPAVMEDFFRLGKVECGPLHREVQQALFPQLADLRSAALVPLDRAEPMGLLALASDDPSRFSPDMGDLFLEMTANLCTAALRFHGLGQR